MNSPGWFVADLFFAVHSDSVSTMRFWSDRVGSIPRVYFLISSTRRFWALPSSVVFGATGLVSPNPSVVRWTAAMPREVRAVFTAAARLFDRARFAALA